MKMGDRKSGLKTGGSRPKLESWNLCCREISDCLFCVLAPSLMLHPLHQVKAGKQKALAFRLASFRHTEDDSAK